MARSTRSCARLSWAFPNGRGPRGPVKGTTIVNRTMDGTSGRAALPRGAAVRGGLRVAGAGEHVDGHQGGDGQGGIGPEVALHDQQQRRLVERRRERDERRRQGVRHGGRDEAQRPRDRGSDPPAGGRHQPDRRAGAWRSRSTRRRRRASPTRCASCSRRARWSSRSTPTSPPTRPTCAEPTSGRTTSRRARPPAGPPRRSGPTGARSASSSAPRRPPTPSTARTGFFQGAGPKFTQLEVFDDGGDFARASSNVQTAITKYPDLGVLLGLWSYNATRIAQQVKASPEVRERTTVVTFDLDELAVNDLVAGDIDATVCQNPYEMGYQGVKLLKALIEKDEKTIKEVLPDGTSRDTGVRVIVPNADSPVFKNKDQGGDSHHDRRHEEVAGEQGPQVIVTGAGPSRGWVGGGRGCPRRPFAVPEGRQSVAQGTVLGPPQNLSPGRRLSPRRGSEETFSADPQPHPRRIGPLAGEAQPTDSDTATLSRGGSPGLRGEPSTTHFVYVCERLAGMISIPLTLALSLRLEDDRDRAPAVGRWR